MNNNPSLADVRARRAEIANLLGRLQEEDKELSHIEDALIRLFKALTVPAKPRGDDADDDLYTIVRNKMTGKENLEELIELMLDECNDDWWTTSQVQEGLTEIKDKEVPMSSVAPTLSNMKAKGTLVRNGPKVALASRAKNQAAAE